MTRRQEQALRAPLSSPRDGIENYREVRPGSNGALLMSVLAVDR